MAKKLYPTDTLEQANSILIALHHIDPSLAFGPATAEALAAQISRYHELKQKIERLERELIGLRYERDTTCLDIYDKVKRARAGIKAFYGDDSTEYEIAGGTRRSERKKPRRKVLVQVKEDVSI